MADVAKPVPTPRNDSNYSVDTLLLHSFTYEINNNLHNTLKAYNGEAKIIEQYFQDRIKELKERTK